MAFEELSNSDYEIKDGQQDITGWNVIGRTGEKIGEVEDLLFDPQAQQVRYLVIQLQASGEEMDDDDKRVLAPVGVAELRSEQEEVALPIGSAEEMAGLPAYESGGPEPEDEVQIRAVFGGSKAPYEQAQFYQHEHFDDSKYNLREEPRSTAFPEGKVVGEFQSSETGNNDSQLNEGFIPEPENVEQEEQWQDEQETGNGNSKLMEFFVDELKDLLWAEKELVDTLLDMAEAATSQELKQAFESHLSETETHVSRLEQIFGVLGLEPDTRKCEAMAGIIDEGDEIISATDDGTAQRDVGLIFAGQKAEHYEIASYGGMIALAKTLGYYEIAETLVLTLDEEKSADAKLTEIAESQANEAASLERTED